MMDERIHGLMKGRAYCAKKGDTRKKGNLLHFRHFRVGDFSYSGADDLHMSHCNWCASPPPPFFALSGYLGRKPYIAIFA